MKKQITTPISETQSELNDLQVKKVIENCEAYNPRIKELKAVIDYFNYGLKQK